MSVIQEKIENLDQATKIKHGGRVMEASVAAGENPGLSGHERLVHFTLQSNGKLCIRSASIKGDGALQFSSKDTGQILKHLAYLGQFKG